MDARASWACEEPAFPDGPLREPSMSPSPLRSRPFERRLFEHSVRKEDVMSKRSHVVMGALLSIGMVAHAEQGAWVEV